MARKKDYRAKDAQRPAAVGEDSVADSARTYGEPRAPELAHIDMEAALGQEPLGTSQRTIDLRPWLGQGIDPWVWGVVDGLEKALRSRDAEGSTLGNYGKSMGMFFEYLTAGRNEPLVATPSELSPLHTAQYTAWLQKRAERLAVARDTIRNYYNAAKFLIRKMMDLGLIKGEPSRFFPRGALTRGLIDRSETVVALSDAEQQRLADAIKHDLRESHHKRISLPFRDVQALRFLLVAHRQGLNTTPLLELDRTATLRPGLTPDTRRITVVKRRGKKHIIKSVSAATPNHAEDGDANANADFVLTKAEAVVLEMAMRETEDLAREAKPQYRNRVWLFRSSATNAKVEKGEVIPLAIGTLRSAVAALVERHSLLGDDGKPMKIGNRRLRKSFFARAMRITDGDIVKTANLMGNTPNVAAISYSSFTDADKAAAAEFMNDGYVPLLKDQDRKLVIPIKPAAGTKVDATAVSSCGDALNGQYAPGDGRACDRFVMCLFCDDFAVVGEVEELWRLFSFQVFAKAELAYLNELLDDRGVVNERLAELRERYRLGIPHIDEFTRRQFPASVVAKARSRTVQSLHPFWATQLRRSERGRPLASQATPTGAQPGEGTHDAA